MSPTLYSSYINDKPQATGAYPGLFADDTCVYERDRIEGYVFGKLQRGLSPIERYSSYTKQYSNPYGPMGFSYGGKPPIPASKSSSAFNPRLSDPFRTHLGT
jgi:hypothetical protein